MWWRLMQFSIVGAFVMSDAIWWHYEHKSAVVVLGAIVAWIVTLELTWLMDWLRRGPSIAAADPGLPDTRQEEVLPAPTAVHLSSDCSDSPAKDCSTPPARRLAGP